MPFVVVGLSVILSGAFSTVFELKLKIAVRSLSQVVSSKELKIE